MKEVTEELKLARQRRVTQSQPEARESEEERGKIAPVWAVASAWGALAVSEEQDDVSHAVELKNSPDSEERLSLDLIALLKERQQQKFGLEWKMKAAEEEPVRKGARRTVRETSVVVLDNENDVKFTRCRGKKIFKRNF